MNVTKQSDPSALLKQLFGDNRAEWPPTQFQELFVPPTYLKKLESKRPCILVGGRGTGKTTSLQSLRYESTLQRLEGGGGSFSDQEYLGVLVRINKNRVRAFCGGDVAQDRWARLFSHYFNLLVCQELVGLASWLELKSESRLTPASIRTISSDLGFESIETLQGLEQAIRDGISKLQLVVNNPDADLPLLASMAEAPLRTFVDQLNADDLLGQRVIFCCIDEYENLLDYQQAILNTYIKHAEPPLSYKVGVRKNGLRNRQTLDGQDVLKTPDDYAEIEVSEEGFEYFAKAVGELRLLHAKAHGAKVPGTLKAFLEELSTSEEAMRLGADNAAAQVINEIREDGAGPDLLDFLLKKPASETYFLRYWQETKASRLIDLAEDWRSNEKAWSTRIDNYAYASLFWLSTRKGQRIHKYYCGERVTLALAGGNIRYFLELIDAAIGNEIAGGLRQDRDLLISAKAQTFAARDVGKRRLSQLEGLADHGPQLKRLVLAVGKVFFELARTPVGHAPEINSFVLSGSADSITRARALLAEGVAHLAFEVDPRTKATTSVEMRDDEYRLHPIFSAFFEISHRRKRRMTFEAEQLLAVLEDRPARAISELLAGQPQSSEDNLPEQLAFFAPFYGGENER